MVTIDDLAKLELVVGTVREVFPVAGSTKLLRLLIDLGETRQAEVSQPDEQPIVPQPMLRQILSGIAKNYTPENLLGKQVLVIANLESRMMMGFESRGMVLAAHGELGPVLLGPNGPVPPGAKIS